MCLDVAQQQQHQHQQDQQQAAALLKPGDVVDLLKPVHQGRQGVITKLKVVDGVITCYVQLLGDVNNVAVAPTEVKKSLMM